MQAATECDIKYSSSCPETLNCSGGGIHNDCQGYQLCSVILTHWQLLRKYWDREIWDPMKTGLT